MAGGDGRPERTEGGLGIPSLTYPQVRRVAALVAVLVPLLLIGLGVLASNPDYQGFGLITGVLVMIAGLYGLLAVRTRMWRVLPGALLLIALLSVPAVLFPSELMVHRGVRVEAIVTAAHSTKGKNGSVSWTCDIRRVDGQPLPHATLGNLDCWGKSQVGTVETVVVDPGGWAPPVSTDVDYSGMDVAPYAVGGAAVLWGLMVLLAARRSLRTGREHRS